MVPKGQMICYHCYNAISHVSPECTAKITDMNMVVANYERFSEEQKASVQDNWFKLARKYLKMKRDLAIPTCNSKASPQNESRTLIEGLKSSPK